METLKFICCWTLLYFQLPSFISWSQRRQTWLFCYFIPSFPSSSTFFYSVLFFDSSVKFQVLSVRLPSAVDREESGLKHAKKNNYKRSTSLNKTVQLWGHRKLQPPHLQHLLQQVPWQEVSHTFTQIIFDMCQIVGPVFTSLRTI